MDILISFAAKLAEYTVKPIARQVGYLVLYNAKFEELANHVKELNGARDGVMHRVEEERRSGKIIETSVQNWLDTVDRDIREANQLQEDHSQAKVRCFKWLFPNLVSWHPLGRKATKMSKNIVQTLKNKTFEQVAYLPALDVAASTYVTKGNENFESRKQIMEKIMKALKDPKTRKIGVYGLGGVGKTTLVKEVAQLAKQENLFDVVVMADVSKTPDLKTIQGEIADQFGLTFKEETVAGRARRLYQRIMGEKTILIILDDIWERLDLEKVEVPFRDDHNGCKLLMTSRSQDVLREMLLQEYIRLEVLNEEETWGLFKAMAGDVETEPLIHQLAHQVAKRCAGLPILIVTVARSLINQDIHTWKDALRQLERTDNKEMQEITYSALELTYNRLQGKEMKALFLLCAAFGKWPYVSYLFKCGMGLGIFNNTDTMESAWDRFYIMIRALKASCLLLESDTSTRIAMHDVVREVAISIASREERMLIKYESEFKEWPTKDFLRSCSQIIIRRHIRKLPEMLDCPNLKLLYLGSDDLSIEVPDSCFEEMKSLQVLDLTGFNLASASLPISFHSLCSLKTLCLDHCILENMDAIEALENLEILSLISSSMMKLPSEIGKLTHLRMLDLSDSGIEVMPPKIISSLIRLEELYLGNTSIKWEEDEEPDKPKENASLTELRGLLKLTALELQIHGAWVLPRDLMFDKLEKYKIVIGDVWEWPDIAGETLKTLKLKLSTNIHLEHGIKTLIKRVENLYLDEVEGIENVLYQLNGEGFPELKHLHIQNHAMIKHIIDSVDGNHAHSSFPKLETLVVQNLNCLEKICQGPLIVNSFAKLRIIKVENCIQLQYLLSFSMVKELRQLSEIKVCRCNSMEKVVFGDGDANADNEIKFFSLHSLTLQHLQSLDSFLSYELASSEPKHQRTKNHIPFFKAQLAFPNLETLKLSSLDLNKIWEDNQNCFHKLTNLIVESCSGLKCLFSYNMVRSFSNLMKLEISDCYMMEEIIATKERNNNIVASEEVRFSKLDTIILKDMENLKTIWHNQFGTLKTLQVENCKKIMVVFPSSMQKTYNNLETLDVTDCPLVEEIFELTSDENCALEDIAQLKRITLRRLPKLNHTWSRDPEGILSFDNLENIRLESCGNLQYLFPISIATSSSSHLQRLNINRCGNMKEIIAQKEGTLSTTAIFKFNQLNTLLLWSLHNLRGFYASNHILECTSLRTIDIFDCGKLSLFKTVSRSSHKLLTDGKSEVSVQQSPFIVEQVIPNLERLRINQKEGTIILQAQAPRSVPLFTKLSYLGLCEYENEDSAFPDWFLQNVNTLEMLAIGHSSFKKIFRDERLVNEKICMRLKNLALYQLPKLLHICEEGFQIDPVLEVLKYLRVRGCPSLLNLVPSSVTFNHLTFLEIEDCNGMVNLISSSTAKSLTKLTKMEVKGCTSLEEIIMIEDGGESINRIVFISLETLILESLPRLSRFCSSKCFLRFPLLKEVVVRQCPSMKNFFEGDISTPKLRKVRTGENKKEGH